VYSKWTTGYYVDDTSIFAGGFAFDDESINPTGSSIVISGQKQTGIDFSRGAGGAAVIGSAYMISQDFILKPAPQVVLGDVTAFTGTNIGGNHGLQLLSTTTPLTPSNTSSALLGHWSADALGPSVMGYKSRALSKTTHAAVSTNDSLLAITAGGDDGATDQLSSQILFQAGGTVGSGHVSGNIKLNTATAAGTMTTALSLDDSQGATFTGGVKIGAPTGGVPAVGSLNIAGSFLVNNVTGLSVTKTVRASGGASDCSLIYTGGILTGGSC